MDGDMKPEVPEQDSEYAICHGDTIYNIAKKHNTSLEAIFTANPMINPLEIAAGRLIVVPGSSDVVKAEGVYGYRMLRRHILELKKRYPFIGFGTAGKSALGRDIFFIRLGKGEREVFYNGASAGGHWITSLILMKFIEEFSYAYSRGKVVKGCSLRKIWEHSSIYIIPMVNPDGAEMSSDSGLEIKAAVSFTCAHDFCRTLSFCSKRQGIYCGNTGTVADSGRDIGEMLARVSGYELSGIEGDDLCSGYAGWFAKKF
jgi:LysM repeat protein